MLAYASVAGGSQHGWDEAYHTVCRCEDTLADLRRLARADVLPEQVTPDDLDRIAELVETYVDFPLGFVDASLVAIAQRLGITRILALDRRRFSGIRPRHTAAFELLP